MYENYVTSLKIEASWVFRHGPVTGVTGGDSFGGETGVFMSDPLESPVCNSELQP